MKSSPEQVLFVSSYATEDATGIYAFALDEPAGGLRMTGAFAGVRNPSFLAVHPARGHLFAVGETGMGTDGAHGTVHAFRISAERDAIDLIPLNHRSTAGDHPCHLRTDAAGRWLAVSNYGTGNVVVFPIGDDCSLGEMASSVQHSGAGPNPQRQEGPHTHSSLFAPDDGFLIVADLGTDRLVVYAFDGDSGSLDHRGEVATDPGSGPRHMAFHPDGRHLFVVNELSSTLTLYRWDRRSGNLHGRQTVSTFPGAGVENTAADIHVSRSGSHVYVSNRGHNSVAVFGFDPAGGLTRTTVRPCGGDWPRGFALAPGGSHIVVANRHSNEVALLPLPADGADIGAPVARVEVLQPTGVVFV